MKLVNEIITKIRKDHQIKSVYFVACGGSLTGFYPAKYFLTKESKQLNIGYMNANEFVNATPKIIDETSVVILASQRGDTSETVEACKVANKLKAVTIGLTFNPDSPLTDSAQHVIVYEFGPESVVENQKVSYGFKLALEILNQVEGYDKFNQAVEGLVQLDKITKDAKVALVPEAIKFAWEYKDDSVIYTMASGSCFGSAHQESICIFMEMQWINSSVIHSGDYFHGPFEITEKDTAFLLLKSNGQTKVLDDRALEFLNKFNKRTTVIDSFQYGMDKLGDVAEYLEPLFYNNVLSVYNNALADARNHPLSVRRYMWKFKY